MNCCESMHPMTKISEVSNQKTKVKLNTFGTLTAWTDDGSASHALYISSTYAELDPLRKGSAAAEL